MSLHHLDPRKAGTDADRDVRVTTGCVADGPETYYFQSYVNDAWGDWLGGFSTADVALATARHAAGYGHVAERACSTFVKHADPGDGCFTCAWPRDAHRVTP